MTTYNKEATKVGILVIRAGYAWSDGAIGDNSFAGLSPFNMLAEPRIAFTVIVDVAVVGVVLSVAQSHLPLNRSLLSLSVVDFPS